MRSIRHLLIKDWQKLHLSIFIWLGIHLVGLLLDLNCASENTFGEIARRVIDIPTWIFFVILTVHVAGDDTPAKRDHFLRTRAVTYRQLVWSKIIFIAVIIVTPIVLRDAVYLLLNELELRLVLLGTVQSALFIIPLAMVLAIWASLWNGRKQFLFALVILSLGSCLIGLLVFQWMGKRKIDINLFENSLSLACLFALVALPWLSFVARKSWYHFSMGTKLGLLVVFICGSLSVWIFAPKAHIDIRADEGWSKSIAIEGFLTKENSIYSITVGRQANDKKDERYLKFEIHPDRPAGLTPDQDVFWWVTETEFGNKSYVGSEVAPVDALYRYSNSSTSAMVKTIESYTGKDIHWDTGYGVIHRNGGQALVSDFPRILIGSGDEGSVALSAELKGLVYQWKVSADLPLEQGQQEQTPFGRIAISKIESKGEDPFVKHRVLTFVQSERNFWLSPRWEDRVGNMWPRKSRLRYVICHAASNRAAFVDNNGPQHINAELSGYPQRKREINIDSAFQGVPVGELRLIVLSPHYLGEITRSWKSSIEIQNQLKPSKRPSKAYAYRGDKMTMGQFALWYNNLPQLSTNISEEDLKVRLSVVLEKVSLLFRKQRDMNSVAKDFAQYVPDYLDLFLAERRGIISDNTLARSFMDQVLIHGLEEEQVEDMISAFRRESDLLPVLERRGWLEQAQPIFIEQWHMGRRSGALIRNMIGFENTSVLYPEFLAELRRKPDLEFYQALCAIPELSDDLDELVPIMLNEEFDTSIAHHNRDALMIALHHGMPEAFIKLHSLLVALPHLVNYDDRIHQNIKKTVDLSLLGKADRSNRWKVYQWFVSLKPEHFRFDPISRKFVHSSVQK